MSEDFLRQVSQEAVKYEEWIKGTLSTDNQIRTHATQALEQAANTPDSYFASLVFLLKHSQALEVRQFCAIIIRQALRAEENIWRKTSPIVQAYVKQSMLELFVNEKNTNIRRKANDALSALAAEIFSTKQDQKDAAASGDWQELIPTLVQAARTPDANVRLTLLELLSNLAEYVFTLLTPNIQVWGDIVLSSFSPQSTDEIRLAATKALYSIVLSTEDKARNRFIAGVPIVFQWLSSMCAHAEPNDDMIRDVVEVLGDVAEHIPTFFKPHIRDVTAMMIQVAGADKLEPATRRMAMEFLLTLAEHGKGMVRQVNTFSSSIITLTFKFLTCLEEDPDWMNGHDEDYQEVEDFSMGVESVDRLAITLGGKIFMTHAMPLVQKLSTSENWIHRHAALMCISEMAEGCSKVMTKQLKDFVNMLIPYIQRDPHPRVRWAALNATAQLASDFAPNFQAKFHKLVMPVLIESMNLNNNQRVVRHAALCTVDVLSGMEQEQTIAYVDSLLSQCARLLQCDNLKIKEAALAVVSATAAVVKEGFVPYYHHFMPGILQILMNCRQHKDPVYTQLKSRTVECVGLIAVGSGPQKFGPDATTIMDLLVADQKYTMENDESQDPNMMQAMARICQCMGTSFAVYLSVVIPPLLQTASREDAAYLLDEDETPDHTEDDGYQIMPLSFRGIGTKQLVFNDSILEEKATACDMIFQYVTDYKEHYFPYVEQTLKILLPLVEYRYNERVRTASMSAMPCLLTCVRRHLQNTGGNIEMLQKMWNEMFSPMMECVKLELNLSNTNGILVTLREALEEFGSIPTDKQIEELITMIDTLMQESLSRINERAEARNNPDYDETEAEQHADNQQDEDEHLSYLAAIPRHLSKISREKFLPIFKSRLNQIYAPLLSEKCGVGERCAALCVYDDVIDFCGPLAAQHYSAKFLPFCIKYALDEDADVRQAALYGIGVVAQRNPQVFAPALQASVNKLLQAINHPSARVDENEPATDCAISSLGKICQFYAQHVNVAQLWQVWLQYLPLTADELEGQVVHNVLFQLVQSNNPHICGENGRNLLKILHVFSDIIDTETTTNELTANIRNWFQQIKSSIPHPVLQQLTPQQIQKLQTS